MPKNWIKDYKESLDRVCKLSDRNFCFVCGTGSQTIDEIIKETKKEARENLGVYLSYQAGVEGNPYDEECILIPRSKFNTLL